MSEELTKTVWIILTGLFGLCIGSFLNVVIYRVPEGMSIAMPPSHCPKCGYRLKWYDNIPILSYVILRGRCRKCSDRISPRYMLVEAGNAILWLICTVRFYEASKAYAVISAIACSVCICIFFIDLEHMIIYDRFQIIMGILGIGAAVIDGKEKILSHVIGCTAAAAVFLAVAYIAEKVLGREALGGGDIKFLIASGLYLGWEKLILQVLLASVSAAAVMLVMNRRGSKADGENVSGEVGENVSGEVGGNGEVGGGEVVGDEGDGKEYPFAPFLTAGFVAAALFGDAVISWYIGLLM